jgi:hypothetical protein
MAAVDQRELLSLLQDARELIDFDAENCDFGPALGMHKMRLKEWKKRVGQILLQNKYLMK